MRGDRDRPLDDRAGKRQAAAFDAHRGEIAASRARLVGAADEARRRLERDLHDGAQQRFVLASIWLKRAAARDAFGRRARDARSVPRAVETAIYFTAAEALTNVAKHAPAIRASVTIDIADGVITAEITDDGIGGATTTTGSGLRGLADRLEVLGGTLTVHSPAAAALASTHAPRFRRTPDLPLASVATAAMPMRTNLSIVEAEARRGRPSQAARRQPPTPPVAGKAALSQ